MNIYLNRFILIFCLFIFCMKCYTTDILIAWFLKAGFRILKFKKENYIRAFKRLLSLQIRWLNNFLYFLFLNSKKKYIRSKIGKNSLKINLSLCNSIENMNIYLFIFTIHKWLKWVLLSHLEIVRDVTKKILR